SVKLERRYGKDEILGRYLNTVYFGRGAYGIEAASRAYFGTGVDRLTLEQGAVLAAVIKDPTGFDPARDEAAARDRWAWVLGSMGAPDHGDYPAVRPSSVPDGPNGLVADLVERELDGLGIPPQRVRTGGLRVVTTIDPVAQRAAVDAVTSALGGIPDSPRAALVAVEPAS